MNIIMPQLGETVLEGTVANWYKKVGDLVQADENLFDVETDKVTSEIPSPLTGIVTEILVVKGTTVKVGTVLAIVVAEGSVAAAKPTTSHAPAVAASPAVTAVIDAGEDKRALVRPVDGAARLSPVVRRLLGENGLSADQINGTGNNNRVTREDVLAYLARPAPTVAEPPTVATASAQSQATPPVQTPAPAAAVSVGKDDLVLPLNKIRRATGSHMIRSLATSPHAVQAVEVNFHAVDKARNAIGKEWKEREGYSLTYLPFIARAVCEAIGKYPYINSSFGNDELIVHKRVHLGIAVDVNFDGLLATVMRDAHHRNLRGLAAEINRLATAARKGQIKQDELSGGTYTISNSGSFGTLFSTSIINQPQAAILSTDGVHKKPVVIEGPDGDVIAIRPIGILAQSFDHRAFDGAYSASFLRYLKEILETRNWVNEL
ncbi:MAG: 2-oxo acid dehydrogenase subunit E2 [Glaciimonas sp.]|nr:2-oxo acid dehydrogenase subunit E2 [Glaciimonas sp.]